MANTDRPHGFDPYGAIRALNKFKCDTTTTAIFRGDVIKAQAAGYVEVAAAGNTQMVGASVGYQPVYSTAGTYEIGVYDDPDQLFHVQGDTDTSTARANVNLLYDHLAGTGSAVTLLSGHELDVSTGTVSTATLGWRLLEFYPALDNDTTLINAEVIVCMNEAARHTIATAV